MTSDPTAIMLLPVFLVLLSVVGAADPSNHISATFRTQDSTLLLQHVLLSPDGSNIYLGATNNLYQLDPTNLKVKSTFRTGPELDSPYCNWNTEDCIRPRKSISSGNRDSQQREIRADSGELTLKSTNNFNQVLVYYAPAKLVINCGTVHQGICTLHKAEDISVTVPQTILPTPVSANSVNASTVAFIAPGPDANDVLYVAATFTYEHYREDVPAVATRSMDPDHLFHLASQSISSQSARVIKTEYLADFRVNYVGGFFSDGFAYWAAVQRKDPTEINAPYESKLLRVCAGDRDYTSYSELPLECIGHDNTNYNIIKSIHVAKLGKDVVSGISPEYMNPEDALNTEFLIAVFGVGESPSKLQPHRAAVCVYPLKEIRSAFWYNIQRCRSGVGHWNLPHYGQNQKCINMSHLPTHTSDDCILGLVGGIIPASKPAALAFDDAILTGVTSSIVNDATVLFLATQDGRIKKAVLDSLSEGRVYSEVQVSSSRSPIGRDLILHPNNSHILLMSANQLIKMRVSACEIHSDCWSCVQSGDPYCGWCTLNNECTSQIECPLASKSHRWLASESSKDKIINEDKCPRLLAELMPKNSSISRENVLVRMVLNALPAAVTDVEYKCVFGESNYLTAIYEPPNTLTCELPSPNIRPHVPQNTDHVIVPLSIWSNSSGRTFFTTEYLLYDCSHHQLCTSCVSSAWSCAWCLSDNTCVSMESQCSNQDTANGESQCPHIDRESMQGNLLLSSGHPSPIKLPVVNVGRLANKNSHEFRKFECSIDIEGVVQRVGATLDDQGYVSCNPYPFAYTQRIPTLHAQLFLTTDTGIVIDKTKITLYKCDLLSDDCSRCLTLDPEYQCSWCGGICQFREFCPFGIRDMPMQTAAQVCPAPVIESISPSSGPLEGGTRVVIQGRDLGTRLEDVDKRVFIGDVPCNVVDYEVSVRIECMTTSAGAVKSGVVRITLGPDSRRTVTSAQYFLYVNPSLYKFSPSRGPRSGGTEITVHGTLLDTGNHRKVWLGNIPCKVLPLKSDENVITCVTQAAHKHRFTVTELRVQFDSALRTFRHDFEYVPDPQISSISPRESFVSGGRQIFVKGTNLNSTVVPYIFLIDPIKMREDMTSLNEGKDEQDSDLPPLASSIEKCTVLNGTMMVCPSPTLTHGVFARLKRTVNRTVPRRTVKRGDRESLLDRYPQWPIGFKMDGVENVRTLGITEPMFELTVVPDPYLEPFGDRMKVYRNLGDPLVIQGNHLSLAADYDDVQIVVGSEKCNVTLLSETQLVCSPGLNLKVGLHEVVVNIGNLRFELGQLNYNHPGLVGSALRNPTIVGVMIAAMAVLLLLCVVCVAIWWRRKSWQAEKEYKRIQMQMDYLESNVRQECKQAFAELQTDMCELTSDHVSLRIPYNSCQVFAAKMLFKDELQQSILTSGDWSLSNSCNPQLQTAVTEFESLLWDKEFIVHMVDTFETQPTFGAQDKVYVASLLTAILARDMQYCTHITMQLLRTLIRKSVDSKYPQLMLRRTESIVEKMLANWISLCMHDFLYSHAGNSLFLLFMALKHQIEKGPVDAVSAEARYCLSEDRLLKEHVKAEALYVHVLCHNTCDSEQPIVCRVLQCDTITQAKGKILDVVYRNTPFSARPTVYDLDLEWRPTPSTSVILTDDDKNGASARDVDYRRLNTLESCGVRNDAFMALLPRRPGSFNYQMSHTYASINSSTQLIPGDHSPEGNDRSVKYWHLSTPSELPNSPYTMKRNGSLHKQCEYRDFRTSPNATMHKNMPEIYLTRLLTSKGTVQKYVDDFFTSALKVDPTNFPPVIKYLFDFLENEADKLQVTDPSVVQAWKNNSLPLRFWVNVIKNPDFVFDIDKSSTVDSCLSVVAQTFMDACSPSEVRLGKDSPSNKLLFAKDMPKYRNCVAEFYKGVRNLPPICEEDMNSHMAHVSKIYGNEFSVVTCVRELLSYVMKYDEAFLAQLYAHPNPNSAVLANKLSHVLGTATGQIPVENDYASVR